MTPPEPSSSAPVPKTTTSEASLGVNNRFRIGLLVEINDYMVRKRID